MAYHFAAQVAEVEVDTRTGNVQVVGLWAAHDPGKVIFPQGAYGQLFGGIAQGLGYALMEQITYTDGYLQETNFESYLIPTSVDVPELVGTFVEAPFSTGPVRRQEHRRAVHGPHRAGHPERDLPRDRQARPRPARQPGARPAGPRSGQGWLAKACKLGLHTA